MLSNDEMPTFPTQDVEILIILILFLFQQYHVMCRSD